jgi:hypothetical protein
MSRAATSAPSTNLKRFKLSIKLEGADNVVRWRTSLQEKLFRYIKNTNMDSLTAAATLDAKYFKASLADEWKEAARSDDNKAVEPFEDKGFVQMCLDHALETGEGFQYWLYDVFEAIRESLSEEIADQTAGVALGDLDALLKGINLAIGHFEDTDPDDLDLTYSSSTMEKEGKNDVMTYTSVLANCLRRLSSAGHKVPDSKAQRVLLRGLNQDVFEAFVLSADRTPYDSYADLLRALKIAAAKPRTLAKLKNLKPGTSHSAMTARAQSQQLQHQQQQPMPTPEHRLDRIENILTTLATNTSSKRGQDGARGTCFDFERTGTCSRGSKCKFSHVTGVSSDTSNGGGTGSEHRRSGARGGGSNGSKGDTRPDGGMFCTLHNKTTHNTADCAVVKSLNARGFNLAQESPTESVNVSTISRDFMCPTRVSLPTHIFAMLDKPKVDLWCVDGAATVMATWDRTKCFDIVPCNVSIVGPNSKDSFFCTEMGSAYINALNKDGSEVRLVATGVLISPAFPFHIFSEIKVFKSQATCTKKLGSWQFNRSTGEPLFHASQRLLSSTPTASGGDIELYFIDECPRDSGQHTIAATRVTPTIARKPQRLAPAKLLHSAPVRHAENLLGRKNVPVNQGHKGVPENLLGHEFFDPLKVRKFETPRPKVSTAKKSGAAPGTSLRTRPS